MTADLREGFRITVPVVAPATTRTRQVTMVAEPLTVPVGAAIPTHLVPHMALAARRALQDLQDH